jgi:hypothetical protein
MISSENVLNTKLFELYIQEDISQAESDDELEDLKDLVHLPEFSSFKNDSNLKEYHAHLPIDDGIYEGLMNEEMLRDGFGMYSINNGEEYYAGKWKDDKKHGEGYWLLQNASVCYYGMFNEDRFQKGYGKAKLKDGYTYEGKFENNKFEGLGELSISIDGLSNDSKTLLKVVADWKGGKISTTYLNEVKDYFEEQYDIFNKCLQIISGNLNDMNSKRIYLKILIELLENGKTNNNLLIDISKQSFLPKDLKISADLLVKLEIAYEGLKSYMQVINLEKSFIDCVKDACINGINMYTQLQWSDYLNNNTSFIKVETIFSNQLMMNPSDLNYKNYKQILSLDPLIVELIKRMMQTANERVIDVPNEHRDSFISIQTNKIKGIWQDYLEDVKEKKSFSNHNEVQSSSVSCDFYKSAYYCILNSSRVTENVLKIEFNSSSINFNLNGKLMQKDNLKGITVITIDKNQTINFENIEYLDFSSEIDSIVIAFSKGSNKFLKNIDLTPILWSLDIESVINDKLTDKKFSLVLIQKVQQIFKKVSEIFSEKGTIELASTFKSELIFDASNENISNEIKYLRHKIDILIFDSMNFILNNLRPWQKTDFSKLNNFLQQKFSNLTIKQISDKILIKILTDSKIFILEFKNTKYSENILIKDFDDEFQQLIDSYETSLKKDEALNYEFRIKEINEIINYFISILCIEEKESFIIDIVNIQLENINEFLNSKENISKLIRSYVDFNSKLKEVNDIYVKKFEETIFVDKSKNIVDSCKKIFNLILNAKDDENITYKESEISSKYSSISIFTNFLSGLCALDYDYYGDDKVKVVNMKELKREHQKHGVLESLTGLLELIEKERFLEEDFSIVMNLKARAELINSIWKSFKYFGDQLKYASVNTFIEDSVQPYNHTVKEECTFDEFNDKLQKIELYFLYNRKLREITVTDALNMFKEMNVELIHIRELREAYKLYEENFNEFFESVFEKKLDVDNLVQTIQQCSEKWIETSIKECNVSLRLETVPKMLALISLVYSLMVSNFITKTSQNKYNLKESFNKNYFLKPHCIQILGILRILALDKSRDGIRNHSLEILTGQGKSWVLAIVAIFFSMIGYDVTVACYSEYLSERDKADFSKYTEPFNLKNLVSYKTFDTLCNDELQLDGSSLTLRELVIKIIKGEELNSRESNDKQKKKSILLIDEVDVFFTDSFGEMYHPDCIIKSEGLREIHKFIWERLVEGKTSSLKYDAFNYLWNKCERKNDIVVKNLYDASVLKDFVDKMVDSAMNVHTNFENYKDNYKIEKNIIYYKNNGKFVSNVYIDYNNAFMYLKKMYDSRNGFKMKTLNDDCYGYLKISTGHISYSELPKTHDAIFGVSGSLASLSYKERELLNHYDIKKISYCPSFFGKQKLKFNQFSDFKIEKNEVLWYNYIISRSKKVLKDKRALLIFFDDENLLNNFFVKYSNDLIVANHFKPYYITMNKIFNGVEQKDYTDAEVNKLIGIEYAGHIGSVTLLTKEFGRGVDFQVDAEVVKNGGLHVIQTFYSLDIKEEIQIKGRTARKDDPGSYEMILCLTHLKEIKIKNWSVTNSKVSESTTYDELAEFRRSEMDGYCSKKTKNIENNKKTHDKTIEFYKRALSQYSSAKKEEYIREIKELETQIEEEKKRNFEICVLL